MPGTPVLRLENIFGLFPSQDAVPTQPARKVSEQIRMVAGAPYIYDPESGTWIKLGGAAIYAGRVGSDGTAGTPFPAGWTAAKSSAGRYTVTHNLGSTDYAVTVTNISAFSNAAAITDLSANSFEITLYENTTGATWNATDTAFMFMLATN